MMDRDSSPMGGWPRAISRTLLIAASYALSVAAATYPAVLTFSGRVIGQIGDPFMYFYLMRWSRTCLLTGRSPFFDPGMHYPTGVPLGYFPPLHFQSLCYILLGPLQLSDVLAYNIIWTIGVVGTGLSAYGLAYWVSGDHPASWLAGLAAMLSGPMMMHMYGHLDLIQLWGVPLFLVAWIRFVDVPRRGRLFAVVAAFLVVTACAPYYMIFVLFPAGLYVVCSLLRVPAAGRMGWIRSRSLWFLGCAAISLPGVCLLLAGHIWTALRGMGVARPVAQFLFYTSPPWSYVIPSPSHTFGKAIGGPIFQATDYANRQYEGSSYLGVVVIGLLVYALCRRLAFPRSWYWWSALAMLAILSLGAEWRGFGIRFTLPAGWLWAWFPPFHLIRVPSRFNLFVAVCASIPVSIALVDLLGRVRTRRARGLVYALLAAVIVADAANVPFPTSELPAVPGYYDTLRSGDKSPAPALLEAPLWDSTEIHVNYACWGYWHAIHGMKTTAGYSSLPNNSLDSGFVQPSPFWGRNLIGLGSLDHPDDCTVGIVEHADFAGMAWLQLHHYGFDYLLLHHSPEERAQYPMPYERLQALLGPANILQTDDVSIYDPAKLPTPTRPVLVPAEGWRLKHFNTPPEVHGTIQTATVLVYSPSGGQDLAIRLTARSFLHARKVRLREEGRVLADWDFRPDADSTNVSPPFRLSPGIHTLTIESDGVDTPRRGAESIDHDKTPFSLIVKGISIGAPGAPPVRAGRPEP